MSRVIRQQTLALVLEVEASVAEAQEGHAERVIQLPDEVMTVAELGRGVDWHGEVQVDVVRKPAENATHRQVLSQLLSWMAILDHFDDAVSTSIKRV
jgi:hypothetical protein